MRKAISFLGTKGYSETTYVLGDKEFRTDLFPEALSTFSKPDEILIFVTQDAEKTHLGSLKARLDGNVSWRPIHIPDGKDEAEIWDIFETLTQSVNEGDKIIFDITHAFRSIPFLAMIAISYLRAAKEVEVEAVLYGAWEARVGDRSPVFDLTPFVTLLDWTNATDKFLKTGYGYEIAGLLKEAHQVAYRNPESKDGRQPPKELKNVAKDIEEISRAMILGRSEEVMKRAWKMANRPKTYRREADDWAKPFSLLLDKIDHGYSPFSIEDPRADIRYRLDTELQIVEWLLEKGLTMQAILLSREWVVTYYISRLNKDILKGRQEAENELNNIVQGLQMASNLPEEAELARIWANLTQLRNDVAHCGNRENPMPSIKLVAKAKDAAIELGKLMKVPK